MKYKEHEMKRENRENQENKQTLSNIIGTYSSSTQTHTRTKSNMHVHPNQIGKEG